jgi:protein-tyrosine phosphatase
MSSTAQPVKVLMVCLGNICRSPTAEGVLRSLLQAQGLHEHILVDSAGTAGWHQGEPPDSRSIRAAATRGYDLSSQRSRPVVTRDFDEHDYILAMDQQNLRDLEHVCPPAHRSKLGLLLQHGSTGRSQVPDPYEGPAAGFDEVIDLCENACAALLQYLVAEHGLNGRCGR